LNYTRPTNPPICPAGNRTNALTPRFRAAPPVTGNR